MRPNPVAALSRWWRASAAVVMFAAALIAGCGGSVGVGGTGSYSSGPIDGFGSIFVSGVEFDDSRAAVVDEDGAERTRAALRLGMSTEVDSEAIGGTDAAPTAVATRIRMISELIGLASDIDVANGTLVVFDQTVQVVDGATAFDPAFTNGLASVADGAALAISASFDAAANAYVATLVAPLDGVPAFYQARGTVQDLDITARTFRLGAALFVYEGSPPLLENGAYLRVRVATTPVAGRWMVTSVAAGARELPDLDRVKLRGAITRFVSATDFSLNGQPVDARTAQRIGPPGNLALGEPVVVDGSVVGGVIVAKTVRLDRRGGANDQGSVELNGAIQSVDLVQQTIVVRDTTVYFGGNGVQFSGGTQAELATGRAVKVRGVIAGQSSRVKARRISFS
ncbi:MAG: hypothetical protein QM722_22505 [Piscinibacter sp.]